MGNLKKKKASRVSIRDIAREAGISKAATSYALQNKPRVSRATRERVLRIARRLGYAPDARMAVVMATLRGAKAKELAPLAWLNTHAEKDAWHKFKYLTPYLESARNRALQLGYRLEEIWLYQPGMTMSRISKIIDQRGIEGVVVTSHVMHFRLNWNHLAAVSIESTVMAPRLHRVTTDSFYNFLLTIKTLKRYGYRRIGVCLEEAIDSRARHGIRAMIHHFHSTNPVSMRVPPFFFRQWKSDQEWRAITRRQIIAWLRRHRPDALLGHSDWLVECAEAAGHRVPEDIGVVHLATDDDVSDWAGIYSNKRTIGAAAVEWVVSLIRDRQFGVPETAINMSVQGTWHPGHTLLTPKPG